MFDLKWINGFVILTLPKAIAVFTQAEWGRAIRRGKTLKRRTANELREEKKREGMK